MNIYNNIDSSSEIGDQKFTSKGTCTRMPRTRETRVGLLYRPDDAHCQGPETIAVCTRDKSAGYRYTEVPIATNQRRFSGCLRYLTRMPHLQATAVHVLHDKR